MKGTALITGGAKRIGKAITLSLAELGFDIALHYNRSGVEAEQLSQQVRAMGRKCRLFPCDLGETKQALTLIETVFDTWADCNVLVNNASIFEGTDFLETDEATFDVNFNVNFKAAFFLAQAFARRCKSGQIINIADARVGRTTTAHFAYTLSKRMLWEFTKMAARRLGPDIRVNAVCPGLILLPGGAEAESFEKLISKLPLRKQGTPEQVAAAVCFLAEADYVTGEAIFIDGGEHLRS